MDKDWVQARFSPAEGNFTSESRTLGACLFPYLTFPSKFVSNNKGEKLF